MIEQDAPAINNTCILTHLYANKNHVILHGYKIVSYIETWNPPHTHLAQIVFKFLTDRLYHFGFVQKNI